MSTDGASAGGNSVVLSVPRLLGIVAVIEAIYLAVSGLVSLVGLDDGQTTFARYAWLAVWVWVLIAGAYVLWLPHPPTTLIAAIVRTALIIGVLLINLSLILRVVG